MERIIVTPEDIQRTAMESPKGLTSKTADLLTVRWFRWLLFPLVLVPPLLCAAALALWIAMRNKSEEVRADWLGYLCWLVAGSALITTVCICLVLINRLPADRPLPPDSLVALDSLTVFPSPSSERELQATEIAASFKRHVFVILAGSEASEGRYYESGSIGACVLFNSDNNGHLLLTSRHVVDGPNWRVEEPDQSKVLLASETKEIASAQIVGRHSDLDLALLWLPRKDGSAVFVQSVREFSAIQEGETVFLIGHPEGFLYSMSTGIVSQKRHGGLIQTSAPVSPGNSGGPILDAKGRLLAIVSWKVDKGRSPNAENLNFGVRADAILDTNGWKLVEPMRKLLEGLSEQSRKANANPKAKPTTPDLAMETRNN